MNRFAFSIVGAAFLACVLGVAVEAVPFDPLFRVVQIEGTCSIQQPGAAELAAAVEGKAYPYGSRLRTGRNSSAIIRFSQGNDCRVLARADLQITKDTSDPKLKIIKLDTGKIEITLDDDFEQSGDGLNVETASAICGAIGCEFSVDARTVHDLKVVVVLIKDGTIRVFGPHFKIPIIGKDQGVTVSSPRDMSFTRIKNVKGTYDIEIIGSDGEPKTVETQAGTVIKIWRRKSDDGKLLIVSILIAGRGGELEQIHTHTEVITGDTVGIPHEKKDQEQGSEGGEYPDWQKITTTTTTTSTTSTTTIPEIDEDRPTTTTTTTTTTSTSTTVPSPTPVGKR